MGAEIDAGELVPRPVRRDVARALLEGPMPPRRCGRCSTTCWRLVVYEARPAAG
jgi:hypothetical protein